MKITVAQISTKLRSTTPLLLQCELP